MKNFVYSLMTDRRKGVMFMPFKLVLYLLSLVYGLAIYCRKLLYRFKIFRSQRVPIKIISVGNLTLGGTGKTPFVIKLAEILEHELRKETAVLIRGYGWDEQAMLKKKLPDVPILVGEDRARLSHKAIRLYGTRIAILDDGFQYWELERNLNIVLVDSRSPFGNGHLFPRGVLREPVSALGRADVVVFTKTNKKAADLEMLKADIKKIKAAIVFLEAAHKPKELYDHKARKAFPLSFLAGRNAVLLSSIGDPVYFEETARDLGARVVDHIAFSDHHNYRASDAERIKKRCGAKALDLILTTEKDAVKLARMSISFGDYSMMTLSIEMDITSGKELLIDRLHSLHIG